jgi:dihydrofolate reductase
MGSADRFQTLFKNDRGDEIDLMIIPITLGTGKRLFESGASPASFKVTNSQISPNGNIVITYKRDGDVKTGAPQIKEDDQ